jgi:hypothetical protein
MGKRGLPDAKETFINILAIKLCAINLYFALDEI